MKILMLGRVGLKEKVIEYLESLGNDVVHIDEFDPLTIDYLRENGIEYLISFGYGPIIKEPVLSEYKNKILNIHPTYLPYGKGTYGNFWSYFEGTPNGVSLAYINAGIDTGNVLFRKQVSFKNSDTLEFTHSALMDEVEKLFFEKWKIIASGNATPIIQSEMKEQTRSHSRVFSEKFLDILPKKWKTTVEEVKNIGAEYTICKSFWEKYLEDIEGMKD